MKQTTHNSLQYLSCTLSYVFSPPPLAATTTTTTTMSLLLMTFLPVFLFPLMTFLSTHKKKGKTRTKKERKPKKKKKKKKI
jgi:hypothetical protein